MPASLMPLDDMNRVSSFDSAPLEAAAVVVGRALEVRQPQKTFADALLEGEVQDRSIQRDKHGDLRDRRQAASQRIRLRHLVELGRREVHALLIFRVALANFIHVGLQGLIPIRRLVRDVVEREDERP